MKHHQQHISGMTMRFYSGTDSRGNRYSGTSHSFGERFVAVLVAVLGLVWLITKAFPVFAGICVVGIIVCVARYMRIQRGGN